MNYIFKYIILALFYILYSINVYAEPYVEVRGGATFPARFHHFTGQYFSEGKFKTTDLGLQRGEAYGVKAGYFLPSLPAVGFELSYLHAQPKDKEQDYWLMMYYPNRTIGATEGTIKVWVDSVSLNTVLRYPGEIMQPYIAVGPALFIANYGGDPTLNSIGFNMEGGTKVVLWGGLYISGSYVYRQSWLTFRESSGPHHSINGFSVFYQDHLALIGLGYQFN